MKLLFFIVLLHVTANSTLLHCEETRIITVAFWNVEHLFDARNDPKTLDDDFTPEGNCKWTKSRFEVKLARLGRAINDIGGGRGPDIMGLCEVENRKVVKALIDKELKRPYAIVHRDSPDERGIDTAIIYDPRIFRLASERFHHVELANNDQTREIVEACLEIRGAKLYVFANHWPSRRKGEKQSEPNRIAAARVLRARIEQLLKADENTDILVMGDFNDQPAEKSLHEVLGAASPQEKLARYSLLNTSWEIFKSPRTGTARYRGQWITLDQIIISRGLLDRAGFSWVKGSTRVFKKRYLLQRRGPYQGYPYRTYVGRWYLGGTSDHLPVVCRLVR